VLSTFILSLLLFFNFLSVVVLLKSIHDKTSVLSTSEETQSLEFSVADVSHFYLFLSAFAFTFDFLKPVDGLDSSIVAALMESFDRTAQVSFNRSSSTRVVFPSNIINNLAWIFGCINISLS
jgi:hypothetical protein